MFWLGVGLVVVALLFWMWRLDRRSRGATRNLGWDGRPTSVGLLGDTNEVNASEQYGSDAFSRAADRRSAARPSPRDERRLRRRFWRRGPGRSSEDR